MHTPIATSRAEGAADAHHTLPEDATRQGSAAVVLEADSLSDCTDSALSDEAREIAIVRAGKLVEFFMAERQAALQRYETTSHLADIVEADGALLQANEARRLRDALMRGRSPAMLLELARQRPAQGAPE